MATGYSVGNLELSIQTVGDGAITSFNSVNSKLLTMMNLVGHTHSNLKLMQKSLSAISRMQFNSVDRLATGLNKLTQVNTQGLYTKLNSITRILTPLQELSASMSGIGQVNTFANGLQKIVKLDVAGFDTQIKALTASLRPFLQEITVATPALTAFSTAMASLKGRRMIGFKQFDQSGGKTQNLAKTLNLAGVLGKLYFIRNYTKQLGQFMSGLVQSAIDYTETLNLWQVAMRGNIDTAEEFISKMNKAYGIAEQTLMKYQATFRNMLSTLGGVSTDVSYALSEYLTQMALDYASLYNTSIDKAMTVFQSVLSGQVRPIRSISGYDITETTIFQLYQQLGGTKTMRQLSQTEKRLLRIYAVFQQMERSGTIGDLNKTLNNTANQMRIMSESAKELGVWIGKMIELYIAPALPYINAFLITAKNIAQAITKALPNYSEFDGTIKGYEETAEAMDEVQGKLLDFDKFRSLSGGEENNLGLGIDETLIAGLTQYQSILENVSNKATELAEKWTSWWVDDETGKLTEQAENLLAVLKSLGIVLGTLVGYNLISKIGGLLGKITGLTTAMKLLKGVLVVGIIASFIRAVELFDEGRVGAGLLATAIGVTLAGAFIYLNRKAIVGAIGSIVKFVAKLWFLNSTALGSTTLGIVALSGAFVGLSAAIIGAFALITNWSDMSTWQKIIGIIGVATTAILGLAMAFGAFHSAWSLGLATAGIVAGIGMIVASVATVKKEVEAPIQYRRSGGLVEDGLFTMNKGEVMGTFDDGTSIVANNQQIISGIKQGVYQAVVSAMQNGNNNGNKNVYKFYVNGRELLSTMEDEMHKQGKKLQKI